MTWNKSKATSNELKSYWAQVLVRLDTPLRTPDGYLLKEYLVNLGVTCEPAKVHDVLSSSIDNGTVVWAETNWRLLDRHAIDDEIIRSRIDFAMKHGVWYRNGRIFVAE